MFFLIFHPKMLVNITYTTLTSTDSTRCHTNVWVAIHLLHKRLLSPYHIRPKEEVTANKYSQTTQVKWRVKRKRKKRIKKKKKVTMKMWRSQIKIKWNWHKSPEEGVWKTYQMYPRRGNIFLLKEENAFEKLRLKGISDRVIKK